MPPATQNTFDGGMSTRRLDSLPESLMSGRPVAKKKPAPAPPPPPKQQEKPQPKQPPKNAKMEKNNQKKKSAPAPVAIPDKLKKADKSTKADKPKEADNKKEADKPKETDKPKKAEPPRKIAKTALEKEATVFEVVDPEAIFSEPEGDSVSNWLGKSSVFDFMPYCLETKKFENKKSWNEGFFGWIFPFLTGTRKADDSENS